MYNSLQKFKKILKKIQNPTKVGPTNNRNSITTQNYSFFLDFLYDCAGILLIDFHKNSDCN